jgi:peptidyl-tRNA hydrolase
MVAQGAHARIMFFVHRICGGPVEPKDVAIQNEWMIHGMTETCVRVDRERELFEQMESIGVPVSRSRFGPKATRGGVCADG